MLNLIVAACEGMGIGMNGTLPWRLKEEMKHFARLTRTTKDPAKRNAVIMGRKTWESIPEKFRPLPGRLNVILSRQEDFSTGKEGVVVCSSLKEAMAALIGRQSELETFWIIGGSSLYSEAMASEHCHRVYLTQIHQKFECDTFFPVLNSGFKEVSEDGIPTDTQTEEDITYNYKVFERVN